MKIAQKFLTKSYRLQVENAQKNEYSHKDFLGTKRWYYQGNKLSIKTADVHLVRISTAEKERCMDGILKIPKRC